MFEKYPATITRKRGTRVYKTSMSGNNESALKIKPLNTAEEYENWRRRVTAFLRQKDPLLSGLEENATNNSAAGRLAGRKQGLARKVQSLCS